MAHEVTQKNLRLELASHRPALSGAASVGEAERSELSSSRATGDQTSAQGQDRDQPVGE